MNKRNIMRLALSAAVLAGSIAFAPQTNAKDSFVSNSSGLTNSGNYSSNTNLYVVNRQRSNSGERYSPVTVTLQNSLPEVTYLSNFIINGSYEGTDPSTIDGNSLSTGWIFQQSPSVTFLNLTLSNFGHRNRGIINSNQYSKVTINNVTVTGTKSSSTDSAAVWGGVFDIAAGGSMSIISSTIENTVINSTYSEGDLAGGVIHVQKDQGDTFGNSSVTITKTVFQNNSVTSAQDVNVNGGVIYNGGNSGDITSTEFISNSATSTSTSKGAYGGAIYNEGKIGDFTDSEFTSNSATTDGGAIYNTGTLGDISNTKFTSNTAGGNGGAIYTSTDITVQNGTSFSGNTAGGKDNDIYLAGGSSLTLDYDSTVNADNTVSLLSGIASETSGSKITAQNGVQATVSGTNSDYTGSVEIKKDSKLTYDADESTDSYFSSTTTVNDGGTLEYKIGSGITQDLKNIQGKGSVLLDGEGTVNIAGGNSSFEGKTTLSAGKAAFVSDKVSDGFIGGTFTLTNGTTLDYTNNNDSTLTASLVAASSSAGTVNKLGTGTLTLSSEKDYSDFNGTFNVKAGTLAFTKTGDNKPFGADSVTNVIGGAILKYTALSGETLGSDTFSEINLKNGGEFQYTPGTGTLTVNNDFLNSLDGDNKITFIGESIEKSVIYLSSNFAKTSSASGTDILTIKNSTVKPAITTFDGAQVVLDGSVLDLMDSQDGYKQTDLTFDNLTAQSSSGLNIDVSITDKNSDTVSVTEGSGILNINQLAIVNDNGVSDSLVIRVIKNASSDATVGVATDASQIAGWSTNVYEYDINAAISDVQKEMNSSVYDSIEFVGVKAADANSLKKMNNYTQTQTRGFSVVKDSDTYYIDADLGKTEPGTFTVNGQDSSTSIISGLRNGTGTGAGTGADGERIEGSKGSFFELTDENSTNFTLKDVTVRDAERVKGQDYEGGSVLYANSANATFTIDGVSITDNKSYGDGGAFNIVNTAAAGAIIRNSSFSNNTSTTGDGGAIRSLVDLTILNTSFSDNTANGVKNDIALGKDATLTFSVDEDVISTMTGGLSTVGTEKGTGAFTKIGKGTLTLNGINDKFIGDVNVSEGTLNYVASADTDTFFDSTHKSTITVSNDGTLIIDDDGKAKLSAANFAGGGIIQKEGSNDLALTGSNSGFIGTVQLNEGSISYKAESAASNDPSFFNGSVEFASNTTLNVDNTNDRTDQSGGSFSSADATAEFNKNGTGTFELTGKNSGFTGETNINAGTLKFTKTDDTSFVSGKATVAEDAELDYVVGSENTDTLSNLYGSGKLTKEGEGTLTVTNTSNFVNGNAEVKEGTLAVESSIATAEDIDFTTVIDSKAKLDYTAQSGTELTLGGTGSKLSFASDSSGAEAAFTGSSQITLDTIANAANNTVTLNSIEKVLLSKTSYEGTYNLKNSKLDLMGTDRENAATDTYTFDKLTTDNATLSIDVDLATGTLGADKIIVNNNDNTQYLLDLTDFSILRDDGIFAEDSNNTKTVQVIQNNNSSNLSLADANTTNTEVSPTLAAWSSTVYQYKINAVQSETDGAYDSLKFEGVGATNPNTLKIMNNYTDVQTRGFSVVEGASPYHIAQDLEQTEYGNFTVTGVSKTDSIISGQRVKYTVDSEGNITYEKDSNGNYVLSDDKGSFFELTDTKGSDGEHGDIGTKLYLHDLTIQDAARTSSQTIKNGSVIYSAISDAVIQVERVNFSNNTAVGNGGAVYLGSAKSASFTDTDFNSNSGTNGGAFYNAVSGTVLNNVTFNGNTASENGGAIYAAANMTIKNSSFGTTTANSAGGSGNDIYIADPAVLTFETTASTDTGTITSGIAGDGTFTKTGEGMLALSGVNKDFTGYFNINKGTVTYTQSDGGSFAGGNVALADSTILNITNAAEDNIQKVSGTGAVNKYGSGVLNLNGSNSGFTGTANIEAGQLKFNYAYDNDSYFGTDSTTNLASGTKLNVNIADGKEYTLTSTKTMLQGSGQIEKSGDGKLVLKGDFSGLDTDAVEYDPYDWGTSIKTGTVVSDGVLEYIAEDNSTNNMVTGGVNIAEGTEFIATNKSSSAFTLFENGTENGENSTSGTYKGGLTGSGSFTTNGDIVLKGDNYNFGGQTTVNAGILSFTKTEPSSFVQGDVKLAEKNSKVIYTTDYSIEEQVASISSVGTFEKEGSGELNLNNTNSFTGTINANAGTLNVKAPEKQTTEGAFNFSTNITNSAVYNYTANTTDTYTLNSDSAVKFIANSQGTAASDATASFTNGTYTLESDLSGAAGNTTSLTSAIVNVTGTSYSGNYTVNNSTLNLADGTVSDVKFNQLSTTNTNNLNLDFSFAGTTVSGGNTLGGSVDTLTSTKDASGTLTLSSLNLIDPKSDNGTIGGSYNVLSGLTWASDYSNTEIASDIYQYTASASAGGTALNLEKTGYVTDDNGNNLTLYILNHERYGNRTFSLVGDSTEYYIGQDLLSTNSGDAKNATAGTLNIIGRTTDRADTIIARANADSKDGLSMFELSNANTTLNIKDVTIKNASAENGSVIKSTADSSSVVLDNVSITDNTANNNGGAIYNSKGTISITDSNFTNNTITTGSQVYSYGGAVYNAGAISSIKNTKFEKNSLTNNKSTAFSGGAQGGAIYNNGTISTITGSFNENTTSAVANDSGGGAIFNNGKIGNIEAEFEGNSVSGKSKYAAGGAIYNSMWRDGSIQNWKNIKIGNIKGSFTNNSASGSQFVYGGAIMNQVGIDSITADFTSNSVTNNSSSSEGEAQGGAILNRGSIGSISGTFENNSVTFENGTAQGGAIFNKINEKTLVGKITEITDSSFVGNSADEGGAIYNAVDAEITKITNTSFTNNTAAANGSAIYNLGTIGMEDVTFSGNSGGSSYIYNAGILSISTNTQGISLNNGADSGNQIINNGTMNFTQTSENTFTVADVLTSTLENDGKGTLNTKAAGKITFNNLVENQTINVQTGSVAFENTDTTNTDNISLKTSALNLVSGTTATVTDSNISGGTAAVDSDSALNFVVSEGNTNSTSAAISGTGTINKTGTGTEVLLNADNSGFTGTANVKEGTLQYEKTTDNKYFGSSAVTNVDGSTSVLDYIDKEASAAFDSSFSTIKLSNVGTVQITGAGQGSSTFTLSSGWVSSDANTNNLIFNRADYIINANTIAEKTVNEGETASKDLVMFNDSTITMGSDLTGNGLSGKDSGAESYVLSGANYKTVNSTLDLVNKTAGDNYIFDELTMETSKIGLDVNLVYDKENSISPYADTITTTNGSGVVELTKLFITNDNGQFTEKNADGYYTKGAIQVFVQNGATDENPGLQIADNNDVKVLSWATNIYKYNVNSARTVYTGDSIEVVADGLSSSDTLRDMNVDLGSTTNRGFSFILDTRDNAENHNGYNIYRNLDNTDDGTFTVLGLDDKTYGKSILSGELKALTIDADDASTRLRITQNDDGTTKYEYYSDNNGTEKVYTDVTNYITVNTDETSGEVTSYTIATGAFSANKNGSMFELVNDTDFEMSDVSVENAKRYSGSTIEDGAAIYANNEDATVKLSNVDFKNNSVESGNGGAIANESSSSFSLVTSTITGNTASGDGGAIYNTSTGMTLKDVTAYSNKSGSKGGAIYTSKDMTITDSSFGVDTDGKDALNYHKWNGTEAGSNDVQNDIYIDDANLAFVTSENNTSTINSGIAGSGTFTKQGTGTLNLNGRNQDFTGTFAVTGGQVNYTKDSKSDSFVSGSVQVAGSTILSLNIGEGLTDTIKNVTAYTDSEGNTSSGNINKDGSGTLNLEGGNSGFTGQTNIKAGTLAYNADETTDKYFGGNTVISNGAELKLVIADIEGQTISKISSEKEGDGTITKEGAGSITLSGDNSDFSGETVINKGTIVYQADDTTDKYFSGNTVINENGTLQVEVSPLDGKDQEISGQEIGKLSGTGNFVVNNGVSTPGGSTTYGQIALIGDNSGFTGTTTIKSGVLAYTAGTGNSYVGGMTVFSSANAQLQYTVDGTDADSLGKLRSTNNGDGILNKLGTGTLNLNNTDSFTGTINANAGTLNVTAPSSQTTSGEFNFSTNITNSAVYNYTANTTDTYTLNSDSAVKFIANSQGTAASGAIASFTNGTYNLSSDLSGAAGNTTSFVSATVNTATNAEGTTYSGNYALNNSTLNLADGTVSDVTFNQLSTANTNKLNLDFSFAGTTASGENTLGGSVDTLTSTNNASGTLTLDSLNVLSKTSDNGTIGGSYNVLNNLTWVSDYSTEIASDIYKYTASASAGGTALNLEKTGYVTDDNGNNLTLYILNHERYGDRTFSLVGDSTEYYIGQALLSTNSGDKDNTTAGTLNILGRTTDRADTIIARANADSKTGLSMFELSNANTTLNIKDVTIKNASAENGSVIKSTAGSSSVVLDNVSITDNTANNNGGAINNTSSKSFSITGGTMSSNSSTEGLGGAIYTAADMAIQDTNFSSNTDKNGANDIYIAGENTTVTYTATKDSSISSGIAGDGNLNKSGSTALNLSGKNDNFTGNLNVKEGKLSFTQNSKSDTYISGTTDITTEVDITNSLSDITAGTFSGSGTLNKDGSENMTFSGDNSGFTGTANIQNGTITYVADSTDDKYLGGKTNISQNGGLILDIDDTAGDQTVSKVAGGGNVTKTGDGTLTFDAADNTDFSGTANINGGTLNTTGVKTDGFDFNVRVTDGKLNYTAADGANISFKSDSSPSVEFIDKGKNATMQFNGGTYSLVGEEIVNAAGNNIIFGKDSDDNRTTTVVMADSAAHKNGNFTIQNAIIDLTKDSGATSERVISNLTTSNTGLAIDVNLTLPNAAYDSINVDTAGSGSIPVSLTTFNIADTKTDDGLGSSYTLNVLKGLTFDADTSIDNWSTTTYEYKVGFDGGDVILTAYKAADNNSLYVMNHETSNNRGFNFTENDDNPYEIGKDLDTTLEGNFVVNGVDSDSTVVSGSNQYSMFEVVNDTNLEINDLTLTEAKGDEGSALLADNDSANIDLNDVNVTNSSSTGNGGAISNKNSETFEMSGGTLSGNTSGGDGGAIYNTSSGTTTLEDITASGNSASGDGGVIYNAAEGTTTLDNFTADGNTSGGLGGAIYTSSDMTITDSNFGTTELNKDSTGQNDIYIAGSNTNVDFVTNTDSTIASGIAGDGNLNKSGDATLNLSGKNDNFTGNLNITSGDVVFTQNSSSDSYITGTTNIGEGTSLTVNNSLSEAIIGEIAGAGEFNKTGSQNAILTGDNSNFTGNANINGGNLVWNADTTTYISGKTNLGDNGGLIVNTDNGADLTDINGTGTIAKTGSGKLILTGDNSGFNGNLDIQNGSFGIDTGSVIGSINNAAFANGTSINLQNTQAVQDASGNWTTNPSPASIENLYFNSLTLNGNVGLDIDVDLLNGTADKVGAGSVTGGGHLVLGKGSLNVISDSLLNNTSVQIAYGALADGDNIILDEAAKVVMGPIQKYDVTYSGGNLGFTRQGGTNPDINSINPSVMASVVATQVGGYLTQVETLHAGFFHMDRYTKYTRNARLAAENPNTYADSEPTVPAFSSSSIPETSQAMWVKPYTSFEKVNLKGGIGVSNVMYGALYGGDTNLVDLGHGFKGVISAFVGYNGSHQAYNGISMNQQGGTLGLTGTLYKGNFFTGLTISTGASAGDAYTSYGTDHFSMITAGIANKTGYNLELKEGKVIIQPSLFLGYTFVNTFDYTNSAGVRINSDPLHAIQIVPGIRIIGNLKHGWQPYAGVDMVWNIMDKTDVMANDVRLPQLSVKPYVQYGVGIQKSWSERFTAFFQTMIRNGGRNGIVLTGGFRWLFGKGGSSNKTSGTDKAPNKTVIKSLPKK